MGAFAFPVGVHQPRHAPPRCPASAPAVGAVLPPVVVRRPRRVPHLPRPVRLARGGDPAAPVQDRGSIRGLPRLRPGLRDDRRSPGERHPAHRSGVRRRRPGHRAARRTRRRVVGASALLRRGSGGSGAQQEVGRGRGRADPHRPRRRRCQDARVRPVEGGRRTGLAARPGRAGAGGRGSASAGGLVPRRLPTGGAQGAGAGTGVRRAAGARHDQRTGTRHRHRRPGRGGRRRLPGDPGVLLATGGAGGAGGAELAGGLRGAGRPDGHVPGAPPRGTAGGTGGVHRARPGQPPRPGAPTGLRGRGTAAHPGLLTRPGRWAGRGGAGWTGGGWSRAAPPDRLVLDPPGPTPRPGGHPGVGR